MTPTQSSDVLAALQWRYATKVFDSDRKIPAETWDALVRSLVLTPSSFGLQPWRFIIVDDPALRAELRPLSWGQAQVTDADRLVVFTARTDVTEDHINAWLDYMASNSGTPLEALQGLHQVMTGFAESMPPAARHAWCVRQVYIALGQLMTTAAMLGVDTCPLEGIDPAAYDRELGLADSGYATACACALGYRDNNDKYAARPKVRFPAKDIVKIV